MSLRGLAVLVVLLAAAVAAVLWLPKRSAEEENAPAAAQPLVAMAANDVGAVEVTRGTDTVRLERRAGVGWVLTRPALEEARTEAAESLLRGVLDARARRVVEERLPDAERAGYGLAPPEVEVRLVPTQPGAVAPVLRVGGTSPVSTDRYVEDERGRLLLADGALAAGLDVSAEGLAERRLVPVPAAEIAGIRVVRPDGEIRLEREGSGWAMRAPVSDRADATDAEAWARLLSGLTGSRSLRDTEQARAAERLAAPAVRVAVTLVGGGTLPEVALASEGPLGPGVKDDPERYAGRASRVPGASPVRGPVPASTVEDLSRRAEALRDPLIASFDVPEVREVRIREGAHALALVRGESGSWTAREDGKDAKAPDGAAVAAWLDRLRLLRATDFAPAGAPFAPRRAADLVLRDGTTLTVEVGEAAGERAPVRGSRRAGVVGWVHAEALPAWPVRAADLVAPAAP